MTCLEGPKWSVCLPAEQCRKSLLRPIDGGYDNIRLLDATGGLDRLLGKSTKKTSLLN
jgi:hypothetical protein